MRCDVCNKKCISISCSYCKKECCSSCIQLEIHECTGLKLKCKDQLEHLAKNLPQVIQRKHNFTC